MVKKPVLSSPKIVQLEVTEQLLPFRTALSARHLNQTRSLEVSFLR